MSKPEDFDFSDAMEYVKKHLDNLEGWKNYKDFGEVKGYKRKFKDTGLTVYRGVGYIEGISREMLIDHLMSQDLEKRKKWDDNPSLIEFKMLKVFNKNSQIAYLRYKSPSRLVYDRECVAVRNLFDEGDVIYNPIMSCWPDHPKGRKTVKAVIQIYCWVIVQDKEDRSRFRVEYFSSVDLKGWIPKWIVNQTSAAQPDNLRLFIEEGEKLVEEKSEEGEDDEDDEEAT